MSLDKFAHADDKPRDAWQRLIAEHVVEDAFEFRDDEHEQKRHDGDGHNHDNGRIDHGSYDLVLNLGRLFLEFSQAPEDKLEHAAELARFHHVHIKIVEDERVLRERFGKCAAALHRVGELIGRIA